ncbi:MAG: substrate-binding domain-containing protein, partial [Bacillota bacterium]
HKKIAFISGPLSHTAMNERYLGYIQALSRAGLNLNNEYIKIYDGSSFFVDEGYNMMMEIMKCQERPTAIFAAADVLAIGAMKALHEMGYTVPKDFSIAGFDDIDMSKQIVPALSTVRIFKRELGNLAGKRLFELINGINSKAIKIIVSEELIIRDSIADI